MDNEDPTAWLKPLAVPTGPACAPAGKSPKPAHCFYILIANSNYVVDKERKRIKNKKKSSGREEGDHVRGSVGI